MGYKGGESPRFRIVAAAKGYTRETTAFNKVGLDAIIRAMLKNPQYVSIIAYDDHNGGAVYNTWTKNVDAPPIKHKK